MATYFPMLSGSIDDVKDKMIIGKNVVSSKNGDSLLSFSQELIIGLWYMVQPIGRECSSLEDCLVSDYYGDHFEGYSKGYYILKELMSEYKLSINIDEYLPLHKSNVIKLVNEINNQNFNISKKIFDDLMNLGFDAATEYGLSLTIDDVKFKKPTEDVSTVVGFNTWVEKEFSELRSTSINALLKSKARGSKNQFQQLLFGKGVMINSQGESTKPITTSLSEGLSPEEYIYSIVGSRKGLIDKGISTAETGYFTARMVKASRDIKITEGDCHTHDGLELNYKECLGRKLVEDTEILGVTYPRNTTITKNMITQIGKEYKDKEFRLFVRSPLTCNGTKGICKKCYGDYIHKNFTSPNLGDNVGIIATHAISEPVTQLTLRTFHSSGGVNLNTDKFYANYDQLVVITDYQLYNLISLNGFQYLVKKEGTSIYKQGLVKKDDLVFESPKIEDDISVKFPVLENMVELRTGKGNPASVSDCDGILELVNIDYKNGEKLDKKTGKYIPNYKLDAELKVNESKFTVNLLTNELLVPIGSTVSKGQLLTTGNIDYKELYYKNTTKNFIYKFIENIKNIFKSEGVNILSIHYEILLYIMMRAESTLLEDFNEEFREGDNVHIYRVKDGMKLAPKFNSISAAGRNRSVIQHMSFGFKNEVIPKIFTSYSEIGYYEADKIAVGNISVPNKRTNIQNEGEE